MSYREPDAITDWDQGSMKLEQLLDLVKYMMMHKDVIGMDIGGEYPVSLAGISGTACWLRKSTKGRTAGS